jgi:hypothetical protein
LHAATDEELLAERLQFIEDWDNYRRRHRREFGFDGRPMTEENWYPWQLKSMYGTKEHSEVLLMAANQVGKSESAGYWDAVDLTGDYPDWWQGFKFKHPINLWLLGVSSSQLKEVLQRQLLGEVRPDGTLTGGWVHPDEIVQGSIVRSPSARGLIESCRVRHKSGGESQISLKSYTQIDTGQESLPVAGAVVDKIRCDEQPPDEIRGQLMVRTTNGNRGLGGKVVYTLTPELGETDLIRQIWREPMPSQLMVGPVPWDEAPHITPEKADRILAGVPEHERDMRRLGLPMMGSGRIFRHDREKLLCDPFPVSERPWVRLLKGIDIGIDHPTAIAWGIYDPEVDIVYLAKVYRQAGEAAAVHANVANQLWPKVPTVFPHDSDNREAGSGKTVREFYEQAGLRYSIDFHNCDEKGTRYVEPGIMAMDEAMRTGKLKVFRGSCDPFLEEILTYHRKDGKIQKIRDDAISAVRYMFMMVRQFGVPYMRRTQPTIAAGVSARRARG